MTTTNASNLAPRRVSKAWQPFADKLAGVLANLAEDQFLVVCAKRSNRFVQFAAQGAFGMRAEAVCNRYLPAADQLQPADVAALQEIGWRVPTGLPKEATPDKDPDGSPNYFIDAPAPVSFAALSALATRTLVEALGVRHPGRLEYHSFDSRRNSLVWPALGLKRASESEPTTRTPQLLLATLQAETSIADLDFDADGDVSIRYGSVLVWIRVTGEPPQVRLLAALLRDVEESPELLARLNGLNAAVGRTLFFADQDCVFATMHVPAAPYIADHVVQGLKEFCRLTDGIDELLQFEFGGRTAFDEAMPGALKH